MRVSSPREFSLCREERPEKRMQLSSRFTIGVHILAVIDCLGNSEKVTSALLAGSIGVNPVIVRNVMGKLKEAGFISVCQGKTGVSLARPLEEVSLYDVYKAVDCVDEKGLFHFHPNPNPRCPVGKNIRRVMDEKLIRIQESMENEMRRVTVAEIVRGVQNEIDAID